MKYFTTFDNVFFSLVVLLLIVSLIESLASRHYENIGREELYRQRKQRFRSLYIGAGCLINVGAVLVSLEGTITYFFISTVTRLLLSWLMVCYNDWRYPQPELY